jgi:hypothetical protein
MVEFVLLLIGKAQGTRGIVSDGPVSLVSTSLVSACGLFFV